MFNKKIIPLMCAVAFGGQSLNAGQTVDASNLITADMFAGTLTTADMFAGTLTTAERVYSAGSGVAKVAVGTAIVGSITCSGYIAYSAASALYSLAFSPFGIANCIAYVSHVNGSAAALPLIYSLAAGSPLAAQEALLTATGAALIANKFSIGTFTGGASVFYAKYSDKLSNAVSSVSWFTFGCFSSGFSDISKAYNV